MTSSRVCDVTDGNRDFNVVIVNPSNWQAIDHISFLLCLIVNVNCYTQVAPELITVFKKIFRVESGSVSGKHSCQLIDNSNYRQDTAAGLLATAEYPQGSSRDFCDETAK